MSLLTVEAKNFLIHKHLKIDLNKESCIVIGDSGKGKSTLSKLILSHIAQVPYPPNPLSDGETEGFTRTTHQGPNGKVYTVTRKYVRGEDGSVLLDRFDVRGPGGKEKSLEKLMDDVFNGIFTAGRFDWNTYFNKKKGPVERYNYFIDAIGDLTIAKNFEKIEEIETQRAEIGNKRDNKKALWDQVSTSDDEEAMAKEVEYYSQERTVTEADIAKAECLKKKKPLDQYGKKIDTHADAIQKVNKIEKSVAERQDDIKNAEAQIEILRQIIENDKAEIAKLSASKKELRKNILNDKQLEKMEKDIIKIEAANNIIDREADAIYNTTLNEIIDFGAKKAVFFNGLQAFQEWIELEKQWNEKDAKIKDLKAHNEKLLTERLPLPDLQIGIKNKKPIVLYKGRELDDSFSTGEQIEIALAIQIALNPIGDNFIVIPNAQDLGSKLREVQAACKKYNIQYLVEMTKPDEEFVVEVIDSEKDIISSL